MFCLGSTEQLNDEQLATNNGLLSDIPLHCSMYTSLSRHNSKHVLMSTDTVKWSAALLKMCLGIVTHVVESPRVAWEQLAVPALLVLAVLPTLAGEGRGDKPPGKGDLD